MRDHLNDSWKLGIFMKELVKIEIALPSLPTGYEYTGEYRRLSRNEEYFYRGRVERWEDIYFSPNSEHIITVDDKKRI